MTCTEFRAHSAKWEIVANDNRRCLFSFSCVHVSLADRGDVSGRTLLLRNCIKRGIIARLKSVISQACISVTALWLLCVGTLKSRILSSIGQTAGGNWNAPVPTYSYENGRKRKRRLYSPWQHEHLYKELTNVCIVISMHVSKIRVSSQKSFRQ